MIRWSLAALLCLTPLSPLSAQISENPHGDLPEGLDCSACHTAKAWSPLRSPLAFSHGERGSFLITGAHEVAPCAGCHLDLRFTGPEVAMAECAGCHVDVHEGRMVQDCTSCHTTTTFRDVDGESVHERTSFPLTGAHRQVTCESCHLNDRGGAFTSLEPACVTCHLPAYQGASSVDHIAFGYPTDCTQCHSTLGWGDTPAFDHAGVARGFALIGAHNELRCETCHVMPGLELRFTATDQNDCVGCHQGDFDRRHAGSTIPTECLTCHTVASWDVEDFDHGLTGFDLVGSHARQECAECHTEGGGLRFPSPAEQNDCVSCHQSDFEKEHGGSDFPTTCLSCHNVDDWDETAFDHSSTSFSLAGAHATADCATCHGPPSHLSQSFAGADNCLACHQSDYDQEHGGTDLPTTCLSCHGVEDWSEWSFDHDGTAFPLVGAHTAPSCADCHGPPAHLSQAFDGAEGCVACHQADYDEEHASSGFPLTCLTCHNQAQWDDAVLDHVAFGKGFALSGPHASAACESCHTLPDYGLKFTIPAGAEDCVACHQAEYDTNHGGSNFPTTCLSCHSPDRWEGAVFDHGETTGFVLDQTHASATCESCHTIPDYGLKFTTPAGSNDCVACHQVEYDTNHGGSNFPTTCLSCHAPGHWDGASFDHGQVTGFALDQTHASATCESCHTVPDYGLKFSPPGSAQDCVACHQADFDTNHAGSNFPTTCLSCHAPDHWDGAVFDHGQVTGFVLTGPHVPLACVTCHAVPGYVLLFPPPTAPDDCVSCHQGDYDANHAGSGLPTTCLTCHSPDTWSGATVDHGSLSGGFSLLGAHQVAPCASCHTIPAYTLHFPIPAGPNDCFACHQTDFSSAHGGVGYPTDCAACHSVDAWKPSTFNHDSQYFPIFSGKHRGEWTDCSDCHTAPSDLSVFSCLTCHEHSKSKMDDKHKEESGYAYESGACLSCHPTGKAD